MNKYNADRDIMIGKYEIFIVSNMGKRNFFVIADF